MKRPWKILWLGLALGVATFGLFFFETPRFLSHSVVPELAWLKTEYQLSDAEFTRICEMHRAYLPRCRAMCRLIDQTNGRLQTLLASSTAVTPEIETALRESAELRQECQKMMLEHFFEVSRTMPPQQGRRYLAWVQSATIFATDHPAMQP